MQHATFFLDYYRKGASVTPSMFTSKESGRGAKCSAPSKFFLGWWSRRLPPAGSLAGKSAFGEHDGPQISSKGRRRAKGA